jgi:hypothetical protein
MKGYGLLAAQEVHLRISQSILKELFQLAEDTCTSAIMGNYGQFFFSKLFCTSSSFSTVIFKNDSGTLYITNKWLCQTWSYQEYKDFLGAETLLAFNVESWLLPQRGASRERRSHP